MTLGVPPPKGSGLSPSRCGEGPSHRPSRRPFVQCLKPKVSFLMRSLVIPFLRVCFKIFEQFVKTRIKEEYKEKKSKLLLAKEEFKKLLEESKVSPRYGDETDAGHPQGRTFARDRRWLSWSVSVKPHTPAGPRHHECDGGDPPGREAASSLPRGSESSSGRRAPCPSPPPAPRSLCSAAQMPDFPAWHP